MQHNNILFSVRVIRKLVGLALLCATYSTVLYAQKQQRPNIILILTDDLGWSCFSSRMDDRLPDSKSDYYETPNIDRFAAQSLRFTRGYAPDPICTPSRRSIQFGQTSIRQGDESFAAAYAPAENRHRAIPQVLKSIDSRYKAAHFGKWDLRAKITPEQLGYDESDGDTGNKNGDISSDREEKWSQFFITDNPKQIDSITYRSIRFMQEQVRSETPFYLQVSHYATHVNFETRKESYDRFSRKTAGKKHNNPAWAGMISDLDEGIGTLLKSIDAMGIADNTYIFLMADNGAVEFVPPVSNRLDPPSAFTAQMRNYPLRGGKWTLYEGGIRVPFMVRGPGVQGGAQTDIPVVGWDLLPTIAELAGNTVSKTKTEGDGISLVPLLRTSGKGTLNRTPGDFYFHRYTNGYPHSAIISGEYKLIKFWKTKKIELYNLNKDIGELTDISSLEPEKAKELEARLLLYINQVNPSLAKRY